MILFLDTRFAEGTGCNTYWNDDFSEATCCTMYYFAIHNHNIELFVIDFSERRNSKWENGEYFYFCTLLYYTIPAILL